MLFPDMHKAFTKFEGELRRLHADATPRGLPADATTLSYTKGSISLTKRDAQGTFANHTLLPRGLPAGDGFIDPDTSPYSSNALQALFNICHIVSHALAQSGLVNMARYLQAHAEELTANFNYLDISKMPKVVDESTYLLAPHTLQLLVELKPHLKSMAQELRDSWTLAPFLGKWKDFLQDSYIDTHFPHLEATLAGRIKKYEAHRNAKVVQSTVAVIKQRKLLEASWKEEETKMKTDIEAITMTAPAIESLTEVCEIEALMSTRTADLEKIRALRTKLTTFQEGWVAQYKEHMDLVESASDYIEAFASYIEASASLELEVDAIATQRELLLHHWRRLLNEDNVLLHPPFSPRILEIYEAQYGEIVVLIGSREKTIQTHLRALEIKKQAILDAQSAERQTGLLAAAGVRFAAATEAARAAHEIQQYFPDRAAYIQSMHEENDPRISELHRRIAARNRSLRAMDAVLQALEEHTEEFTVSGQEREAIKEAFEAESHVLAEIIQQLPTWRKSKSLALLDQLKPFILARRQAIAAELGVDSTTTIPTPNEYPIQSLYALHAALINTSAPILEAEKALYNSKISTQLVFLEETQAAAQVGLLELQFSIAPLAMQIPSLNSWRTLLEGQTLTQQIVIVSGCIANLHYTTLSSHHADLISQTKKALTQSQSLWEELGVLVDQGIPIEYQALHAALEEEVTQQQGLLSSLKVTHESLAALHTELSAHKESLLLEHLQQLALEGTSLIATLVGVELHALSLEEKQAKILQIKSLLDQMPSPDIAYPENMHFATVLGALQAHQVTLAAFNETIHKSIKEALYQEFFGTTGLFPTYLQTRNATWRYVIYDWITKLLYSVQQWLGRFIESTKPDITQREDFIRDLDTKTHEFMHTGKTDGLTQLLDKGETFRARKHLPHASLASTVGLFRTKLEQLSPTVAQEDTPSFSP